MELGSKAEGVAHVKSAVLSPLTGETNPSHALGGQVCPFMLPLCVALEIVWHNYSETVWNRQDVMYGLNSSASRRVESRGKVTAALRGRTWWISPHWSWRCACMPEDIWSSQPEQRCERDRRFIGCLEQKMTHQFNHVERCQPVFARVCRGWRVNFGEWCLPTV